ncbi:unnamed protein product, partial [marine sediment metagenome]
YNSKTQGERDMLDKFFNKFWSFTIWSKGETLEIMPKDYISKRDADPEPDTEPTKEED